MNEVILKEFSRVIKQYSISSAVITSVKDGKIAHDLLGQIPFSFAIDADSSNVKKARTLFALKSNVKVYHGNPANVIGFLFGKRKPFQALLFFLNSPDPAVEIRAVINLKINAIFAISNIEINTNIFSELYPNGFSKKVKKSDELSVLFIEPKPEKDESKKKKAEVPASE